MIEFPCHCGHRFSVPEEMAGSPIQCPKCHNLNDVPTLSDLAAIRPDGTYAMDAPAPPDPRKFLDMVRAFHRDTYDIVDGQEKDLRPTMYEIQRKGVKEAPKQGHPLKSAPKYDPATGELIRPVEVSPTPAVPAAPVQAARPVIAYAIDGADGRVGVGRVFLELLAPQNAMVMGFIFVFHMLLQFTLLTLSILFPVVGTVFLTLAILAHYGCVVDDIGPEDKDELPRPLRGVSFGDDLWFPFCNVVGSLLLCYGPAIFVAAKLGTDQVNARFWVGSLTVLGTILFPAVFLVQQTSGNVVNLRPDRVLGTIRVIGLPYVALVVLWAVAFVVYVAGIYGLNYSGTIGLLVMSGKVKKIFVAATFLLLLLGIYLMHAFCWFLGLTYRFKHSYFPWAHQKHERMNARERVAVDEATRAVIASKRNAIRKGIKP
jgi:hypothetical protein